MTNTTWSELLQNAKGQLEPVPDGDYNVKIVDAREDKTQTGKLMIRVKFEILDGPHKPRKIPTQLTLSDENPMALAIFFRQMDAMGITQEFLTQLPSPMGDTMMHAGKLIADALLNRACRITLGTRAWQGVDRNEVKTILPPLGGNPVAPGTVLGVATPSGPIAPGGSPVTAPATPTPTPTPATPAASTNAPPELPF